VRQMANMEAGPSLLGLSRTAQAGFAQRNDGRGAKPKPKATAKTRWQLVARGTEEAGGHRPRNSMRMP